MKQTSGWHPDPVNAREQVRARAGGWQQAIEARDAETVVGFLHDDYALVLVVPTAVTMARDEWLRVLADYVVHRYEVHEQVVDVMDDTAVVLTLATQQATVLGQDRSGRFIMSDTWLRDDAGSWQVWRRHSTPITAGHMPRA